MGTGLSWAFWSIFLYLICSIGYIIIDILDYLLVISNSTLYILYIVFASVLVAEAILYTIDWAQYVFCQSKSTSIYKYKLKFFASIFHIIGSIAYLLGGIFGNSTVQNQQNLLTAPQLYVYNIVGTAALLIEAILTQLGWMFHPPDITKTCQCPFGVALWAHVLNVVGGLIYLAASILPLIITAANSTLSTTTIYLNYVRPVEIAGDGVYLIDSMLYMLLWIREWKHRNKVNNDEPIEPESRGPIFLK
jgi:hypothetical protein